jgi:hypothetical protein
MTLGFGVERKGWSFTEVSDKIRQDKKCGGLRLEMAGWKLGKHR